ncbi:MAG: FecR domain-containing protein [Undibacterium sp.]|nr:FecR domain-containing protein [Opitutaceae bacterium]
MSDRGGKIFPESRDPGIEQQAAAWVLRRDRGLSAVEQDELSHWLAVDSRHGAALRRHGAHWNRLDSLGQWRPEHSVRPNADLLAPPLQIKIVRFLPAALMVTAAAAAVVLGLYLRTPRAFSGVAPLVAGNFAPEEESRRVFEDGSVVELNRGAVVSARYTAGERRVRLERGEAHFTVTKNPTRPFIVSANGVDVFAVGTAFNVKIDVTAVEVLVTEGRVQVTAPAPGAASRAVAGGAPLAGARMVSALDLRQRAVVSLEHISPPQIEALTPAQIDRVLAWQRRILDFDKAPLAEIVAEFNRHNEVQMLLVDQELAQVLISASFRSNNVDGFVRLIESGFGVQAERAGDKKILLRKGR